MGQELEPPQQKTVGDMRKNPVEFYSQLFSRRALIQRAAAAVPLLRSLAVPGVVGGGLLAFEHGRQIVDDQEQAWKDAAKSPGACLEAYQNLFRNVSFGTTFIPEDFRPNPEKGITQDFGIKALNWLVEDLGMRHLRVAIRQNTIVDPNNPDIQYYRKYFDRMRELGVRVDICIGAKTPVYPESHIDEGTEKRFPELIRDAVVSIDPSTSLGQTLLGQTQKIAHVVAREYGDIIDHIQPSNEPFSITGKPQFDVTPAYLQAEINVLSGAFPGKPILLNSFGMPDISRPTRGTSLTQMLEFAKSLQKQGRQVTTGYDYYHLTDTAVHLGDFIPDSISWIKFLGLSGTKMFDNYRTVCKDNGINMEATEIAWEQWKPYTQPEKDFRQFAFQLLRVLRNVVDPTGLAQLNLWGSTSQILDHFGVGGRSLSGGQEDMYRFITAVNKKQSISSR